MGLQERIREFIHYKSLTPKQFEQITGLSNGAFAKLSDNTRQNTINRISIAFPELNTDWLLTGEGEMTKPIQQVGDISNSNVSGVNVSGTDIHINPNAYDTLLQIVERNQKTTEKFQEQIDRLISIIEKNYELSKGR